MSLFNFGKAIDKDSRQADSAEAMREEAGNFKLAGTGGFLSIVKYAVFTILACLNFHLFYTHVPGLWGVALGSVAVLFEACDIYFINKQNQSAGKHKIALQSFAITFTVISFVHGCAALYQLSGLGPSIENPIEWYSKFVAFPLLFGLMIFAVYVLHHVHYSTKISESRAKAVLSAEEQRAQILTESLALQSQAAIEEQRLEFFKGKVILEEKYVGLVEEFAKVKTRGARAIESISDPEIRAEMLNAMGRTATLAPVAQKRINPLPAASTSPKDPAPSQE